jgi:hypothetical protein
MYKYNELFCLSILSPYNQNSTSFNHSIILHHRLIATMFLPSVHAEGDRDVLVKLIEENPLGILITGIPSLLRWIEVTVDLPES